MKTAFKIYIAGILYKIIKVWQYLQGNKSNLVRVCRYGINWELDLREGIDLAIYIFGQFESQTVKAYKKCIQPGDIVLDIGANIGAHTLWFAKLVGDNGHVIAFEPTRYAYEKLQTNIELNLYLSPRITANQILLSTEDKQNYQSEIYSSWTVSGTTTRHPKHRGELKSTEGASMWKLDSYLVEQGIERVDFIKIDVDGYECYVFWGAEITLKKYKPTILLELSPYVLEERGTSIESLLEILENCGYELFHEKNQKKLPMSPAHLKKMIGDGASINAIAKIS